jgi:hypothetical protein
MKQLLLIALICVLMVPTINFAQIEEIKIGQDRQTVISYITSDINASTYKIITSKDKVQFVSSLIPNSLWEYQFNGSKLKKIFLVSSYNPAHQLQSMISMISQSSGSPKTIKAGNITKYYWSVPGKGRTYLYVAYHPYYGANCMITEKISE